MNLDLYGIEHITAAVTVAAHSGAGMLLTVNVNTAAAGATLTINDGGSTVLAVVDCGSVASKFFYVPYYRALSLVIAGGSPDVTVGYLRQPSYPDTED